jgi:hypothetical protein
MPSGGKRKGTGPKPFCKTDDEYLDVVSNYRGLVQERKFRGLPGPHRPIVVSVLAEYHKTSPRTIERALYGKLAKFKTAKRIRSSK